jgi:hypothetical protein
VIRAWVHVDFSPRSFIDRFILRDRLINNLLFRERFGENLMLIARRFEA